MRVVLQAKSGRRAGHRIWLGANQRVLVGSNEWAEFAVPSDPRAGEIQFSLECDHQRCRIRNLMDSDSLLVNGKLTKEQTLVDGDIVTAGITQFTVGIQESAEIAACQDAMRIMTAPFAPPQLSYRVSRCESGLLYYSGQGAAPSPLDVARMLGRQFSFYLLVDPQKAGIERPSATQNIVDLFARDDLPATGEHSLLVFAPQDPADRYALFEQAWGKQAAIGVFSPREQPAVLQTLRSANLWLMPPEIICNHLATGAPYQVQVLLSGIKAVLLENGTPGEWAVFASPQISPLWMQLGFPHAPEPDSQSLSRIA